MCGNGLYKVNNGPRCKVDLILKLSYTYYNRKNYFLSVFLSLFIFRLIS